MENERKINPDDLSCYRSAYFHERRMALNHQEARMSLQELTRQMIEKYNVNIETERCDMQTGLISPIPKKSESAGAGSPPVE